MTAQTRAWLLALGLVLGAAFLGAQSQTVQGELKRLTRIWDGTDVWLIDSSGNGMVGDGTGPLTVDGTVTANAGTNLNTSALALDATVTNRLPAGATPADNESNAITTSVLRVYSYLFDGTTWDRWPGDSTNGAKVQVTVFPDNEPFNQAQRGGTALVAGRCEREEPIPVDIRQTANTQLITGVAAERIYICSFHAISATAQNIALVDGTGTTCGTGTAPVTGFGGNSTTTGWPIGANGGLVLPATTQSYGTSTTNADNVCLFQSGAGQVTGGLTYVSIAP